MNFNNRWIALVIFIALAAVVYGFSLTGKGGNSQPNMASFILSVSPTAIFPQGCDEGNSKITISEIPAQFYFSRNLAYGSSGVDVWYLQIILNSDSATSLGETEDGSPGCETEFFGQRTRDAVVRFQMKYKSEILTQADAPYATGYVGSSTKAKFNILLAAARPQQP